MQARGGGFSGENPEGNGEFDLCGRVGRNDPAKRNTRNSGERRRNERVQLLQGPHRSDHDQNMSSGPKGSRLSLEGPSLTLYGNRSSSCQNEQRSLSASTTALRFSSRDDSWYLIHRADQPDCRREVLPSKYPPVAAARTVRHVNLEGTQRGLGVLHATAKGNRQKSIR